MEYFNINMQLNQLILENIKNIDKLHKDITFLIVKNDVIM